MKDCSLFVIAVVRGKVVRLKNSMNAFIFIGQELVRARITLFLSLTIGFSSLVGAETVPGLQVAASVPVSKAVVKINPIFEYPSVFTGYSFFKDQTPASWQKSNQTVQQIGGWRAYAKEVHTPESLAPSSSHQHHKGDENKSNP